MKIRGLSHLEIRQGGRIGLRGHGGDRRIHRPHRSRPDLLPVAKVYEHHMVYWAHGVGIVSKLYPCPAAHQEEGLSAADFITYNTGLAVYCSPVEVWQSAGFEA